MNINFNFLLIGTSLSLIPNLTRAQCAVTDCQQLGYTSLQKCDNGLKCPFGEYWACPKVEEKAVLGECTGYAKNCKIGDILNSDGTCSSDKISGKTPIGVVVYIGGDNCGQALSLKDLGSMYWSTEYIDISGLPNYTSVSALEQDFNSCDNTQKIIKQGTSGIYQAAWATVNYVPNSAPVTKSKWCLPAVGVARSMMNNYDKINSGLSKAGGELLPEPIVHNYWYWSSSEYDNYYAWVFRTKFGGADYGGVAYDTKNRMAYVRPVLAF